MLMDMEFVQTDDELPSMCFDINDKETTIIIPDILSAS